MEPEKFSLDLNSTIQFNPALQSSGDAYRLPYETPRHSSRFGGLWTDLSNAAAILDGKANLGLLKDGEYEQLKHWIEKGYVVISEAVPIAWVDELITDIERVWHAGHPQAWVNAMEDGRGVTRPLHLDDHLKVDNLMKLIDTYEYLESARRCIFASPILRFLELVFERPAMAHQSLSFYRGSKQPIHQDTAFVRISSPMELAASWIALEDVTPDSGELIYVEGSHKFPEFLFEDQYKWLPPGSPQLREFYHHLNGCIDATGKPPQKFLPKKGDALIWSADLAHGGSDYTDSSKTRKSLVTHYCPLNCHPMYFHYGPYVDRQPWNNRAWWCAMKKEFWRA